MSGFVLQTGASERKAAGAWRAEQAKKFQGKADYFKRWFEASEYVMTGGAFKGLKLSELAKTAEGWAYLEYVAGPKFNSPRADLGFCKLQVVAFLRPFVRE